MTKIPSVDWEAKFEIEFSHIKSTNKHIPAQIDTRDYKDIKNFITTLLTADRTALLTELRDCELLEERKKYPPDTFLGHRSEFNSGHNTLARAIKAHLDELIKSNNP